MADETTAQLPQILPGEQPGAAAPNDEKDDSFKAETASVKTMTADEAEAVRRKAFEAATGKAKSEEARRDPEQSGDKESQDETVEEDDEAFDQDNGVDEKGRPVREKQAEPRKQPADRKNPEGKNPEDAATPEQRTQIVKARQALRLDGYQDSDIDALPAGTLIRLGAQAQDRQRKVQAALREAADIRKRAAGGNPGGGDSIDSATASGGQRARRADPLDALLDELEGKTPLRGAAGDEPEETKADDPNLAAIRSELEQTRAELLGRNLRDAKSSLLSTFPQMRGSATHAAVLAKMDELDPSGTAARSYEGLAQLMRDAAYIVIGPALAEQARQERQRRVIEQKNGSMDAPGTTNREPRRNLSADDKRRIAFETAKKAGSPDEARKMYRERVGAA